jgi:thioredoxin-dependent peroxiredoxin
MDFEKGTKGRRMGMDLGVGAKAPAFKLPRDGGGSVALKDFKGRSLVLYFYPKADTPGCTREAIDFTKLRGEFERAGADVLGVSADPVAAQDKFKRKHSLTIALGSDETHEMLEAYGVWGKKSMYGRTFMGVIRATFLVRADGRIARIWPKVRVPGHAEEVLAAARALSG